jgi:uncharacterized membrane protein YedE/YeeE
MVDQSWIHAAIGGAMIGLASGGLMLMNGRIAGISGIFHQSLAGSKEPWRWTFLLGLLFAGLSAAAFLPGSLPSEPAPTSIVMLIAAGLLVGFGTRMASGCTSGHGICGLARFSPRSLVAVVSFLGTGIVVTYFMRLIGLTP